MRWLPIHYSVLSMTRASHLPCCIIIISRSVARIINLLGRNDGVVVVLVVSQKPYVVLPCLMHIPIISGRSNRTERMARKDDISTQLVMHIPFYPLLLFPPPSLLAATNLFIGGGECVC